MEHATEMDIILLASVLLAVYLWYGASKKKSKGKTGSIENDNQKEEAGQASA